MSENPTPITTDMIIQEVIMNNPVTMEVFFDYGIHCVGCGLAAFETIGQGATAHGIDPEELVKDLNWIINS